MTKEEYQQWASKNWGTYGNIQNLDAKAGGLRDLFIMTAGLGGESGEVLELLKKSIRDHRDIKDDLILELGDVLYYLTMITSWHGFTLEDIMYANKNKIEKRKFNKKENAA